MQNLRKPLVVSDEKCIFADIISEKDNCKMKIRENISRYFPIAWEKHPFLYGLFSLGDFGGSNAIFDEPDQSDAEALRQDWMTIGNDIRKAMRLYGKEVGSC